MSRFLQLKESLKRAAAAALVAARRHPRAAALGVVSALVVWGAFFGFELSPESRRLLVDFFTVLFSAAEVAD